MRVETSEEREEILSQVAKTFPAKSEAPTIELPNLIEVLKSKATFEIIQTYNP